MRNFQCENCDDSFWTDLECTWHRIIRHGEDEDEKNPELVYNEMRVYD